MKHTAKFIIFSMFLGLSSGCISADYRGTDVLTFVPGGSTYKHYKRAQISQIKNQTDHYKKDSAYEHVEFNPRENVIELKANGERQEISVELMGFFESLKEDGAGMSMTWDALKTLIAGALVYELNDSNGGGSGGSSGSNGSQSGNVVGGDATIINNSGDGVEFNFGSGEGQAVDL